MDIYCKYSIGVIVANSKNCKYTQWYAALCYKAANRATSRKQAKLTIGYVEAHHVVPRSLGLVDSKLKQNLVYLTAREHFICHVLLAKILNPPYSYPMLVAFVLMSGRRVSKSNSRKYQALRLEASRRNSIMGKLRPKERTPAQVADNSARRGKKIGRVTTEEFLQAHRARVGRPRSEAEKQGQHSRLAKTKVCPYCTKVCGSCNYTRWHGENCTQNPNPPPTRRSREQSPETIALRVKSQLGRKNSEETKARMRLAALARGERRRVELKSPSKGTLD